MSTAQLRDQTIADFGHQWTVYRDNEGYYGSMALLQDVIEPLLRIDELRGAKVADIGSGTGRIVNMLLAAGVQKVVAIEPSAAFVALEQNTKSAGGQVERINARGEDIPQGRGFDYVVSLGVLHHIPDPDPVVRAAHNALRPGGRLFVWLYGIENNRAYLAILRTVQLLLRVFPDRIKRGLCSLLALGLTFYGNSCRVIPALPLATYLTNVYLGLDASKRELVIYDQINPSYAKYYSRDEALELLRRAGFRDVKIHHRHNYSWSVIGTKA